MVKHRSQKLAELYRIKYPKAVYNLKADLEDALTALPLPLLDVRKVSSNNILERLIKEKRRRTRVIGIFLILKFGLRLVADYLMEHLEDWTAIRSFASDGSFKSLVKQALTA